MPRHLFYLAAFYLCLSACTSAKESVEVAQRTLPQQTIHINSHGLLVEIATNDNQRRAGLAHRTFLAANSGMLFVYNSSKTRYFTTAETTLALSIAFLNEQGIIVDIQKMQPLSDSNYKSKGEAQYVLEVNQGWFLQHQIRVGDRVMLPDVKTNQ